MAGWLLDTNVLSELVRPRPAAKVQQFVARASGARLSVITLHEIAYGVERAADAVRRTKLSSWLAQIAAEYGDRVIAIDAAIATRAGRLRAAADSAGHPADPLDALIAATAIEHGLRLATRNVADFKHLAVEPFDPWA